jgi:hypothetical protein
MDGTRNKEETKEKEGKKQKSQKKNLTLTGLLMEGPITVARDSFPLRVSRKQGWVLSRIECPYSHKFCGLN